MVLEAVEVLKTRHSPTTLETAAIENLAFGGASDASEDRTIGVYADYMAQSGVFATEVEIRALCTALPSITIEVYR